MGMWDKAKKIKDIILGKDNPEEEKKEPEQLLEEPEPEQPEEEILPEPPEENPEDQLSAEDIQNINMENAKKVAWEINQVSIKLSEKLHGDILRQATNLLDEIAQHLNESSRVTTILLSRLDNQAIETVRALELLWKSEKSDQKILEAITELKELLTVDRYRIEATADKTRLRLRITTAKMAGLGIDWELVQRNAEWDKYSRLAYDKRGMLMKMESDHPDYVGVRQEVKRLETLAHTLDQQITVSSLEKSELLGQISTAEQQLFSVSTDEKLIRDLIQASDDYVNSVVKKGKKMNEELAVEEAHLSSYENALAEVVPILTTEQTEQEAELGEEQQKINKERMERAAQKTGTILSADENNREVPVVPAN